MSTKRMLIDASHPEETRVVVLDGSRIEDFDVEVASRRQLKGNIYLAKVTRVEPSLQAAFIDYGGNRHGFLAFNEIHPDYYQIPIADRERLLAEQAAAERDAESKRDSEEAEAEAIVVDEDEEMERRRARLYSRYYKIQEVIKRRQIMLVQVAKEERGNKGAALTTYLSLAGRYCVLMPNTSRGGGISRKIAGVTDRKRLKKIIAELEVPEGMAVIVRTAGAGRSKAEIKRDYEYLVRLWSSIRETTLQSTAPTLVYEEASLIKRSIRDLYGRDIAEIIVQGEEEYRTAKEFMKLFISSHAKRVKPYEDAEKPLFQEFGVEEHLDLMHQPIVQLRSGGYMVINPTEALVAIDVNSGRSTRERNIEETALRTNLEAADEIARQLRLRDLAGLIVIDFIDMETPRNQGMVERRLKEAMKNDRARVQIGRISPFGLLELSRQRLRPSLIETCFEICPACHGNGLRRTTESTALAVLRKLEEEGIKRRASELAVTVPPLVAMYLLNQKRRSLVAIEGRYGLSVDVVEDPALVPPEHHIDRLKPLATSAEDEASEAEEAETPLEPESAVSAAERDEAGKRARRRRPRRRRRSDEESQPIQEAAAELEAEAEPEAEEEDEEAEAEASELAPQENAETPEESAETPEESAEQSARKRRRRGKRGGRRRARVTAAEPLTGDTDAVAVSGLEVAEALIEFVADESAGDGESEQAGYVGASNAGEISEAAGSQGPAETASHSDEEGEHEGNSTDSDVDAAIPPTDTPPDHILVSTDFESADEDDHGDDVERTAEAGDPHRVAWPMNGEQAPVRHARPLPASQTDPDAQSQEASEIVVVGGIRPAIEDPSPEEDLKREAIEQAGDFAVAEAASVAQRGAEQEDEVAQEQEAEQEEEAEEEEAEEEEAEEEEAEQQEKEHQTIGRREAAVTVVGEARPALQAREAEDDEIETSVEPQQTEAQYGRSEDIRENGSQYGYSPHAIEPLDDGGAVMAEASGSEARSSREETERLAERARRTEIIRVGEQDGGDADGGGPRRGWWQRLLS